ncbi:Cornichon [Quillaja saponaria]|uniref:Cornichon n=1 Tax=Quillaja saponaria TaxID=32244 RepID=A0AAD7Q8F5_QUISA|nr:Cornichon [Quillaja saponaria]
MAWNFLLWCGIIFPANIALVASTFYQVLVLTDLEADYVNPYDAASRVNRFIVPEFIGQGVLCAIFLLTGHWFMFLLAVPLTCYHAMLYAKRQHLIDVTEVFSVINAEKKLRWVKLAFYMIVLVIIIFRLTLSGIHLLGMDDDDDLRIFW